MRNYLFALRKEKHLSQTQVAERADIAQSYYNGIENANKQKDMSFDTMQKLAMALEIPITTIFELESKYKQTTAAKAGQHHTLKGWVGNGKER